MLLRCLLPNLRCLLANWVPSHNAKLLVALLSLLAEVAKGQGSGGPHARGTDGKGEGRGKTQAGGAAQPATKGRLGTYIRQQRRKRWHRHLQRLAGSKQNWGILADTGLSAVTSLVGAQTNPYSDDDAEAAPKASREEQ